MDELTCGCALVHLARSGFIYKSTSPFAGLVKTEKEERESINGQKGREINEGGGIMRAQAYMIIGLADKNQDLSQRSQLTPSPFP